jgi:hypothetical protein
MWLPPDSTLARHPSAIHFRQGPAGERDWIVDESNSQCELRFDEKLILVKKRKIFVAE